MGISTRFFALVCFILFPLAAFAQEAKQSRTTITAKLYGFVRGDAAVDTRLNASAFEGLFLLYPLDVNPDANGADLNKVSSAGFYSFNSRLGVDVGGLSVFDANVTARLEGDFAGFSGSFGANYSVLRIRQAYIKMGWEHSALTIGQTWHPLFGPVTPDVISLSVGAPFNPFNRSPMFRYDYQVGRFQLSAAAIYQFQFTSLGPAGKSNIYQRQGAIPEFYAGVTYAGKGFLAGAGFDYLTIAPRIQSVVDDNVYKVAERLGSPSATAYARYSTGLLNVAAKTIYGKNLSEQTMLGGYGVSSVDPVDGRQTYTNFAHSTSWVNVTYGKKYVGGIFAGYSKSLGSDKAIIPGSTLYMDGARIEHLYRLCGTFTYNIANFMFGAEYEMTTAGYGDGAMDYTTGRYHSTHEVTNHRVVGVIAYMF